VAAKEGEARVELSIPGRPEYVSVARLAILGVASRMRFSYDEVEDIRLAVGEACTTAIERANGMGQLGQEIRVRCLIDNAKLIVEVCDNVGGSNAEPPMPPDADEERGLGGVLIRILMDDVSTHTNSGTGQRVLRMVKHVAR